MGIPIHLLGKLKKDLPKMIVKEIARIGKDDGELAKIYNIVVGMLRENPHLVEPMLNIVAVVEKAITDFTKEYLKTSKGGGE